MARIAALLVGIMAGVYGAGVGRLLVSNAHSPRAFAAGSLGATTGTALAAVILGCLFFLLMLSFRKSPILALFVTLAWAFIAWELYPRSCELLAEGELTTRCVCRGWSVAYYPKGVMDAEDVRYCIGVEESVG